MKLIQAHILRELLRNALLILMALLGLYFVLGLAFTLGSSRAQGAPMIAVLGSMSWEVVSNLGLTLPLTVLSATLFTYGRWSSEGEWTAARSAGIPPFSILAPALLVGALGSAGLAYAWNGLIPMAHFQKKVELRAGLLRNLETILTHGDRQVVERRWKAEWQGWHKDANRHLVLEDLVLLQLDDAQRISVTYQAHEAVCLVDERLKRLSLELRDLTRASGDGSPVRLKRLQLHLDLDALSERQFVAVADGSRSYDELFLRARRLERLASAPATPPEKVKKLTRTARRTRVELWHRLAVSFSAFFFAFLGTAIGLWKQVGHRAVVFLIGFLITILTFYPLTQVGRQLANSGTLPPGPALWLGNLCLLLLALHFFRRAMRV